MTTGWGHRFDHVRRPRVQALLLSVIVAFLATTLPGVRATPGYSWWMDGVLQNLAYGSAAALCLVRIPRSARDRRAWQVLAAGMASFGLANTYYQWFIRPLDPMPIPSLCDLLWLAFYPCAYISLVLLMRSYASRWELNLAVDGVVVGLGAATVAAAAVFPQLVEHVSGTVAQTAVNVVYPVADLILLALAVFAMSFCHWRPPPALWCLISGLVVFAFVDSTYVIAAAKGNYEPGGVIDAAWVLAVTIVALAPGWDHRPRTTGIPPTWAPLAAPLLAAAAAISVLMAVRYTNITPAASYLAMATLLAALVRLALAFFEARRAGEHAHQARTDDLTGLLNRRGFYDEAAAALSRRAQESGAAARCALLLLDLDHFKDVNDSLGHAAGDELLRLVAKRLTAALPDQHVLGRLGGDEFALLIPEAGISRATRGAATVCKILYESVELDGVRVQADASIGIAVSPGHGEDVGSLLRHADIAMYRAKHHRAGYLVYTTETNGRVTTRAGMERLGELRLAIENGDLAVHYQPKLCLRSGRIIGVEALVRWPHPSHGLLYPEQFLQLARHNSLMDALTEFVVERALDDACAWDGAGFAMPVAVNLSPPNFSDRELPQRIDRALCARNLAASHLTVEITEDFVLGNLDRARVVLDRLRALGVTIAIDDFGLGYSALSYLRDLPIDEVKLDRSFIAPITTDPDAAAIVRSVIDLSHTLRLKTVAEGVETADADAILRRFHCDAVQGHYYSPPVDSGELLQVFSKHECMTSRV